MHCLKGIMESVGRPVLQPCYGMLGTSKTSHNRHSLVATDPDIHDE
jgi:hypothetical protein